MSKRAFFWVLMAAGVIVLVALLRDSHAGGVLHDWLLQLHGR